MKFLVTGGSGFIGTNLIHFLLREYPNSRILNLDIVPPRDTSQNQFFGYCDVTNSISVETAFHQFSPTHVFHLAATTGIGNLPLEYFNANISGVQNVINASASCGSLRKIIFASSLLVCRVGYIPESFSEYCPTTNYGVSKMKGELLVRNSPDHLPWVIVRPISIWGPWNREPYTQFFNSVLSGFYFHIGKHASWRSLGYVENTVFQLSNLVTADPSLTVRKTFYLADYGPSSLREMASKIARYRKHVSPIPVFPLFLVKLIARAGDLLCLVGWNKFPLTSFRLHNLVTEYVFDLSDLRSVCGSCPFDLELGISRTIAWLRGKRYLG